jgi:hypothetical protein
MLRENRSGCERGIYPPPTHPLHEICCLILASVYADSIHMPRLRSKTHRNRHGSYNASRLMVAAGALLCEQVVDSSSPILRARHGPTSLSLSLSLVPRGPPRIVALYAAVYQVSKHVSHSTHVL